ncbi:MAG: transcription antitermination factor NusB [Traorella sp.]
MSRHTLRETAMTCLYQYFLLNQDIKTIVYENAGNEIDPFLYTVTIDAIKHKDYYINSINNVLTEDWEFDRLGCIEKAILLMAAAELDFETASKAVVIDEAVTLSKKYCDEDTYKLINGVLDRL